MSDAIAIRLGGNLVNSLVPETSIYQKWMQYCKICFLEYSLGKKNSVYIMKHSTVVFSQSLQHQMLLVIDLPLSCSNVLVCKNSKVQCNYQENPEKWKIRGTPPKKVFLLLGITSSPMMMMVVILKAMKWKKTLTGISGGTLIAVHVDGFSRLYLTMMITNEMHIQYNDDVIDIHTQEHKSKWSYPQYPAPENSKYGLIIV